MDGPGAPDRGPRAGDRLPDAVIVHNGETTTLHALVAGGPGWHLLRSGPPDVWTVATGPVIHIDDRAGARLGLRRGQAVQYLVRPDGHIGYRSGPADGGGLERYRHRWAQSTVN